MPKNRSLLLLAVPAVFSLVTTSAVRAVDEIIDGGISVTVPGSQSSPWTIDGNLTVGNLGAGTLTIGAGGEVSNVIGFVGHSTGSSGTVNVSGSGALWRITDTTSANGAYGLVVGYQGSGALNITDGGKVQSDGQMYVGLGVAGTPPVPGAGTVTVSGAGSQLVVASVLNLGRNAGTGSMTISDGAKVSSSTTYVGRSATTATALVTGAGSEWAIATNLFVDGANSSFRVENGAKVTTANNVSISNPAATATITGAGTILAATGSLSVSAATMKVENGATASAASVSMASAGKLELRGATTSLTITGNLALASGVGSRLTVSDGATVTAGGTFIFGSASNSTTSATIESGAKLNTTGAVTIGQVTGSNASVTVTGSESHWKSGSDIQVANSSTAANPNLSSLTIADGGKVTVNNGTGKISMASGIASVGTLNIGTGGLAGTLEAAEVTSGATTSNRTAQVNFNHTGELTFSPILTGVKLGVTKLGDGTTILTGANTYSLPTAVNDGTLLVNGSLGNTAVTVASGAAFGGTGTVTGTLALNAGAELAPGSNGIGILTTGNATWSLDASYRWELAAMSATEGVGADLFSGTGTLALAATQSDPFTISLASPNVSALLADFNPLLDYTFVLATTTGGITGFDTNAFALDFSGVPGLDTGFWSVARSGDEKKLILTHVVPEPSAALLGVVACLALASRRKRTN